MNSRAIKFVPPLHPRSITVSTRLFQLSITSSSFSSDNRWIVASSWDRNVYILNARNGDWVCTLKAHKTRVWGADFSPVGHCMVSGGEDNCVKLQFSKVYEVCRLLHLVPPSCLREEGLKYVNLQNCHANNTKGLENGVPKDPILYRPDN